MQGYDDDDDYDGGVDSDGGGGSVVFVSFSQRTHQCLPRMTLSPMTSAAKGSYGCGAQPAYDTPPHTTKHQSPDE